MDYQKVYNALILKRTAKPLKKTKELYTELHHIVPRCLGGSDDKENLVRLTAREHFIAHRLLTKIHVGHTKLALSVILMQYFQGEYLKCSKEISRLKELAYSDASSRFSKLWKDHKFKNFMSEKARVHNKKMWGSAPFRHKMACNMKEEWANDSKRKKFVEGQRKFLNENPWPWQRGKDTKEVWSQAATFWELSRFNPENSGKKYGYVSFCKEFFQGKNQRVFQNMVKMFETGWNPKICPAWLKEFAYKM